MISQNAIQKNKPGELQTKRLHNLISLPTHLSVSDAKCSTKLARLKTSIQGRKVHPYVLWLVADQLQFQDKLDDQKYLEPNVNPDIGDKRIQWLADRIVNRL